MTVPKWHENKGSILTGGKGGLMCRRFTLAALMFLLLALPIFPAPYWYKSQFHTGTLGNCGPASDAMVIQWATVRPMTPVGDVGAVEAAYNIRVQDVRAHIGMPHRDGATSMDDLERVLTHYDVDYQDVDYQEIKFAQIDGLLALGYKLIVLVNLDDIHSRANLGQGLGGHYFVIDGSVGDYFRIQDPYNGADVHFLKSTVTKAMTVTRFILVRQEFNWWQRHSPPEKYTPPVGIAETK